MSPLRMTISVRATAQHAILHTCAGSTKGPLKVLLGLLTFAIDLDLDHIGRALLEYPLLDDQRPLLEAR